MIRTIIAALALLLAFIATPALATKPPIVAVIDQTIKENAGTAVVRVVRSGDLTRQTTYTYKTVDYTAIAGVNYVARSGTGTFAIGQAESSFQIFVLDDGKVTGSKTVRLTITVDRGSVLSGFLSITNTDVAAPAPPPVVVPPPAPMPMPAPAPAPAPPPPPVVNTASVPSPSLSGLPATTAADFVISSAIQAMSATPTHVCNNPVDNGAVVPNSQQCSSAPDNVGAFRFICQAGQVLPDDPIVYPGQPGASHLHQFYGNDAVDAFTDYTSLRAKGKSTCQNGVASPGNRSAYWMPAMLNGAGAVVKPAFVSIYYKRRPASDPKCNKAPGTWVGPLSSDYSVGFCLPIPNGIKFIFGHDMLTGKSPTGSLWFNCQSPDPAKPIAGVVPGHYANLNQALANCPIGALVGAVIEAPSCWNGTQLDSPNHRDHVDYETYDAGATGQPWCPKDHQYVIPTFTLGAWYPVAAGMHFSSDEMVPGAAPGTTFHADYFEGWDPTVKAMWNDNCIQKMLNCSAGALGNGQQMIGAAI